MLRAPNYLALIAVVTCSALLAGCSSDSSDGDGGGGRGNPSGGSGGNPTNLPDPCTLFTAAELETIIGVEIAKHEPPDDDACTWKSAEDDSLLTTQLYSTSSIFDATKSTLSRPAVSGVGADAYLGLSGDIWVKTSSGMSFMAQSLVPVEDKTISAAIKSAASAEDMDSQLIYEAAYRMAKLEAGKL